MTFKIQIIQDRFVEACRKKAIKDLNVFFEFDWNRNLPKIFVIQDRKTIDKLWDKKTESWIVAWAEKSKIFILDRKNYEKESSHKYSDEEYKSLIYHEMSHCFFAAVSKNHKPIWLNEGVAIFTSDQLKAKKCPTKFKAFLDFYDDGGRSVYSESGFAVECLIEKFGEKKLLKLIKSLGKIKNEKEFKNLFEKIYRSRPTYSFFNSLLHS